MHQKPLNIDYDADNWEGDMAPEVTPTREETSHELKYYVSEADYNVSNFDQIFKFRKFTVQL